MIYPPGKCATGSCLDGGTFLILYPRQKAEQIDRSPIPYGPEQRKRSLSGYNLLCRKCAEIGYTFACVNCGEYISRLKEEVALVLQPGTIKGDMDILCAPCGSDMFNQLMQTNGLENVA